MLFLQDSFPHEQPSGLSETPLAMIQCSNEAWILHELCTEPSVHRLPVL